YDDRKGAVYVFENRVSNQFQFHLNSLVNYRLNDFMSLQGGASLNYTKADYFKTIRDLLGGEFWRDIDTFSERDFPGDPTILQNDLNNPNRHVTEGDKFGYDYTINAVQVTAWLQNMITLPQWDINYGIKFGYTQFRRNGHMRNGRAPENSYGKGDIHRFDTGAIKAGATYKIDGRNFISVHGNYETRAPLFEYAYISPRIKDTAIDGLCNERILSADISYTWNYRRFRGAITGFWTHMSDLTEKFSYYDDQYQTFMNYVLKGVRRQYRGIELGMAYKITPSLTATLAGTYARYQYKNRPTGVRSYENGMMPDIESTVYLNNFYVGGTPQTAFNLG
ncbi:MAG: TonB-dependent receptor, partial [Muribaculaceae bacterium]|nr:TonB-dependent receptor [Muribaculaceae bacterium]